MPSKLFGKIPATAGSVTFNAPGEWTVPPGVNYVSIQGKGGAGNAGNPGINGAGGAGGNVFVPANPGNIGNGGGGGGGGGGFFNRGNESGATAGGWQDYNDVPQNVPSGQPGAAGSPSANYVVNQATGGKGGAGGISPVVRTLVFSTPVAGGTITSYLYYYSPGLAGQIGQPGIAGNPGNDGVVRPAISGQASVDGNVGNPGQASSVSKKSGGSNLAFQARTYPGGQAGARGIKGNDGQPGNAARATAGLGGNRGDGGLGGVGGFGSGGAAPHLDPPAIMQPGAGGAGGVTSGSDFIQNANAGAQGSTGTRAVGGNTVVPPGTPSQAAGGAGGAGGLGGSKPSYQGSAGGGGGGGATGQAGRAAQNQPGTGGAPGTGATAGQSGAAAVFIQNSSINVADNDILEISIGEGATPGQVIISWTAQ